MLAERAKAIIASHGFTAFDTADGLVAVMPCLAAVDPSEGLPRFATLDLFNKAEVLPVYDDRFFEEVTVFPVHFEQDPADGFAVAHVDGRTVRQWLGY